MRTMLSSSSILYKLATVLLLVVVQLAGGCRKEAQSPKHGVTYTSSGKEIQLGAWESELPADIVLAIDQSGSMSRGANPTDPTALRVEGAKSFLEFVAGRTSKDLPNRFGVVNFGTDAQRKDAVPLTRISSIDDPALNQIRARLTPLSLENTSFISALRLAMQLLRDGGSFGELRNRAIVVFTDGEPDEPHRGLTIQQYFAELSEFIQREVKPNHVVLFIPPHWVG